MSLFGSDSEGELEIIKGLHLFPSLIPISVQGELSLALSREIFTGNTNQSMLFSSPAHQFPAFLNTLLDLLPQLFLDKIPPALQARLFDNPAQRNIIMNLYRPGEGITPHVDLVDRYQNEIMGISLLSSTVMEFSEGSEKVEVVLRPGDVYIMEGEARYDWFHGITSRTSDFIAENGVEREVRRGKRMSITIRRMIEGADRVGGDELSIRDG